MKKRLLAAMVVAVCAQTALANDTSWKDDFNSPAATNDIDWHDPANWTNGVPTSGDWAGVSPFGNSFPVIGYGYAEAELLGLAGGGSQVTLTGGQLTTGGMDLSERATFFQVGGSFTTYNLDLSESSYMKLGGDATITSRLLMRDYENALVFQSPYPGASPNFISMQGADFIIMSYGPSSSLVNAYFVFNGGASDISKVEVAINDLGASLAGFDASLTIDKIRVGDGSTAGLVSLVDDYVNDTGNEAIYVRELVFDSIGTIDTNGQNLYYLNGGAPKQLFIGDFNLDGRVSLSDLTTLATNYGGAADWYGGDTNGDGVITLADLTFLATTFGSETVVIEGVQVPEPASLCLLAVGSVAILRRPGLRLCRAAS